MAKRLTRQLDPLAAATLGVVTLAAFAVEAASGGTASGAGFWFRPIGLAAAAAAVAVVLRRRSDRVSRTAWMAATLLLALSPLLEACFAAARTGHVSPLELVLLATLRNGAFGLAANTASRASLRLSGLLSLFVVLVASSLDGGPTSRTVTASFAAAGTIWLMLPQARAGSAAANSRGTAAGVVAAGAVTAMLVVAAVLAAAALLPASGAGRGRAGFLPSSGGSRTASVDARGGTGDGDDVALGDHPTSAGFDRSDLFVNSECDGLYDAFVENYGGPVPKSASEKMFMLRRKDIRLSGNRTATDFRSGRTFELARTGPAPVGPPARDRAADALLQVAADAPTHLAMTAFDRFDGAAWHEAARGVAGSVICSEDGGPWMACTAVWPRAIFAGRQAVEVRIGSLRAAAVPTPPHVARFRVGRVNRADFFGWRQPGILTMPRRSVVPPGTVLQADSAVVDPQLLAASPPASIDPEQPDARPVDPAITTLARSWTAGQPEGWPRVCAVIDRLRREYVVDRSIVLQRGQSAAGDAVTDFLMRSHRGPDYLFASAAALMLHELGYEVRLVAGFYADPSRRDLTTGLIPVTPGDAHFWVEVLVGRATWVIVEPTPGYLVPPPPAPWLARGRRAIARWAGEHPSLLPVAAAVMVLAGVRFRSVIDLLLGLAWRIEARWTDRRRVSSTVKLLERRLWWAGRPRPSNLTIGRWLGPLADAVGTEASRDVRSFARWAAWAGYATAGCAAPADGDAAAEACRRVARGLTVARLRRAGGRGRSIGLNREKLQCS